MEKNRKQNKKVQFIVVREFSGEKPMREAFEELIERQTCGQFEKWRQHLTPFLNLIFVTIKGRFCHA